MEVEEGRIDYRRGSRSVLWRQISTAEETKLDCESVNVQLTVNLTEIINYSFHKINGLPITVDRQPATNVSK